MKRKKIIGTMAAILILLIVGAVAVVLVRRPFDAGKPDELLADYFACIEKALMTRCMACWMRRARPISLKKTLLPGIKKYTKVLKQRM